MRQFILLASSLLLLEHANVAALPVDPDFHGAYERSLDLTLDQDGSVKAFWTVDTKRKTLDMAIVAPTTGWLALGLSPQGSMKGADMWILERDDQGEYTLGDYFSAGFERPVRDAEFVQNAVLRGVSSNSTHTAFGFTRSLETCDDKMDVSVTAAPQYLIYAHGDAPTVEYHGSFARGQKYTSLILEDLTPPEPQVPDARVYRISEESPSLRDMIVDDAQGVLHALEFSLEDFNYTVPSDDDDPTSTCFTFDFTNVFQGSTAYFTGFKAIGIDAVDHHALAAVVPESWVTSRGLHNAPVQDNCKSPPLNSRGLFGWTRGNDLQMLPDDVYGYLGDDPKGDKCVDGLMNCRYYVTVSVHYQNSGLIRIDEPTRLGFRVYFRTSPLKHEFGTFRVSATAEDINIPVHAPVTVAARCPSACLEELQGDRGMSIMAISSHSPRASSIKTSIIRDGVELEPLASTPYFDSNRPTVQLRRRLLPGDRLVTTFDYPGGKRPVVGGWTADDELAFVTVFYYPVVWGSNRVRVLSCASANAEPSKAYCGPSLASAFAGPSDWHASEILFGVPTNEQPGADYTALTTEDEVCNVVFNAKAADPLSVITPITFMLLFCVVLIFHLGTAKWLKAKSPTFRAMPLKHQLNVIVYIVSTISCTIALLMTMAFAYVHIAAPHSSVMRASSHSGELELATSAYFGFMAASIVAIVMLYEVVAKPAPDTFLIVHHMMTMAVIAVLIVGAHRTGQAIFATCGLTMTLQLTTEQPTYIAMLLKRFKYPPKVVGSAFKFGAIVAAVLKPTVFVMVVYMSIAADVWGGMEGREFSSFVDNNAPATYDVLWVVLIATISCLQAVQWIQVKQLWSIGVKEERKSYQPAEETPSSEASQPADDDCKELDKGGLTTIDLEDRQSDGKLIHT